MKPCTYLTFMALLFLSANITSDLEWVQKVDTTGLMAVGLLPSEQCLNIAAKHKTGLRRQDHIISLLLKFSKMSSMLPHIQHFPLSH